MILVKYASARRILYAVEPHDESNLVCPRCSYSLRGLPAPRCPECGLAFSPQQWDSGVLRQDIPARLDAVDPWQPHAVLLGGLGDLLRAARKPRQALKTLQADVPLWRRLALFLAGTLWLYLIGTLLIGVATLVHAPASPAAALRSAALHWSPRVTLLALLAAALVFGWTAVPSTTDLRAVRRRHYVALLLAWTPAIALWLTVPLGVVLVIVPEFALGIPYAFPVLTGLAGFHVLRRRPVSEERPTMDWRTVVAAWCGVLWLAGTPWLAVRLVPLSLEPPLWTYPMLGSGF